MVNGFFSIARTSRQETIQLAIPGNVEQKSSTTSVQARKKKSMGIRALSGKQRKDDHIRALLKEHLSEIHALLQLDKAIPLEVGIVCGDPVADISNRSVWKRLGSRGPRVRLYNC